MSGLYNHHRIATAAVVVGMMDVALPQGIFGNTQEIYAEVASYPVVPPEKIKQYWNGI